MTIIGFFLFGRKGRPQCFWSRLWHGEVAGCEHFLNLRNDSRKQSSCAKTVTASKPNRALNGHGKPPLLCLARDAKGFWHDSLCFPKIGDVVDEGEWLASVKETNGWRVAGG